MNALAFTLAPVAATAVGATAATWKPPGPALSAAVQHFAAGVVFAAAAAEILPDVMHGRSVVATLIGGLLGLTVMLLIKAVEHRVKGPIGLLGALSLDLFVDGLVLGLAFIGGQKAGLLLTIALTMEVLFLGLMVTDALAESVRSRLAIVAATVGLALLLPLGTLLALPASSLPPTVITGLLSFGLVALLYLVTEELLVEAHEKPDSAWITSTFFIGFLALLALEELIS